MSTDRNEGRDWVTQARRTAAMKRPKVWWEVYDTKTHNLLADSEREQRAVTCAQELDDGSGRIRVSRVEYRPWMPVGAKYRIRTVPIA